MNSLIEKLLNIDNEITPLHMPGGKRNPKLYSLPDPFLMDITEIEGFDNLHRPEGILKYEMDRAAALYGAGESLFCVNGSSSGLIAAVCGAFEKGSKVIVARNSHICIINALIMRELIPLFLYPEKDENGIYKGVRLDSVKEAVENNPDAKGLILTSPTYEGVVSDTEAIAGYLHEKDMLLIVDEAHGAHFYFSESFPRGAVNAGADLVVNSLHKTLPALTQTALLHINGNRVNRDRVYAFWDMTQTTSPSYVLMGSISACFDLISSERGKELFKLYTDKLSWLRRELSHLDNISLFDSDDPGKLVVLAADGAALYDFFLENKIQLEMAGEHYVTAMTSPADNPLFYDRFIGLCLEADKNFMGVTRDGTHKKKDYVHKQLMPPFEAFEKRFNEGIAKDISEAVGMLSLANVIIYPPGTPLLVAGEIIEEEDVTRLEGAIKKGFSVLGVKDRSINCCYVL